VAPMPIDRPGTAGFTLTHNASLLHRNTLRVDARAAWLAEIHDAAAIPALLDNPVVRGQQRRLLGAGSNVLIVDDFDGVVVTLRLRGVQGCTAADHAVRLRLAAGEGWDDCVRWTLARGYSGLENLVGIPGSVGAAPMQNIGAYGVEVGEFVESIRAFDTAKRRFVDLDNRKCGFGYRDSIFKHNPDRWLITAVTLRLPREPAPSVGYAGLQDELGRRGIENPTPIDIAEAVVTLRARKLPDPAAIGNAGSFFKNPIVAAAQASALRQQYPGVPYWPVPGERAKLSAAWLIEACGCKGLREGAAGISNRHALVLVNHGHASGTELSTLAQRVRAAVHEHLGVTLEPEPRIIGHH
jgi:UDP-N-acetylmuramate dehydrogenase